MSLIQCSECGKQVSSNALSCPNCGNPIKTTDPEAYYENKTARVTCWGLGGSDAIIEKLSSELNDGWEIVSAIEDHWRGGMLRHVYTVVLKRKRQKSKPSTFPKLSSVPSVNKKPVGGWVCKKCGTQNQSNALFCKDCGVYK